MPKTTKRENKLKTFPINKINKSYSNDSSVDYRINNMYKMMQRKQTKINTLLSRYNILSILNKHNVTNTNLLEEICSITSYASNEYNIQTHTIRRLKYLMKYNGNINIFDKKTILEIHDTIKHHLPDISDVKQTLKVHGNYEAIKKLRNKINEDDNNNNKSGCGITCSICFNSFNEKEIVIRHKGGCSALYHKRCIHMWIEVCNTKTCIFNCPCCKSDTDEYISFKYTLPLSSNIDEPNMEIKEDENNLKIKNETPRCSNCNICMQLKHNKWGKSFWGCPNYRNKTVMCKYTQSFD